MTDQHWEDIGAPAPTWAATIQPGDTLVIAMPRELTHQDASDIRAMLREQMPDVRIVLLTGVAGMATYRQPTP